MFNKKEKHKEISGIVVRDKIKYLGKAINDSKNYFKVYKQQTVKKAIRLANMTYSLDAR